MAWVRVGSVRVVESLGIGGIKWKKYIVLNNGWDDVKTESRALEILQEVAEEIKMFTLLAPREESKINLIKICDNLQKLPEIAIRPFDKETYLILTKKDGALQITARCGMTGHTLKIRSGDWRKKMEYTNE